MNLVVMTGTTIGGKQTRIREKLATGDGRQAEGGGVGDDGQGPLLR